MALRTDTDALSLTLPKAKGRSIRKQKPPGIFWLWLLLTAFGVLMAVITFLQGRYIYSCCNTWTAIFAWQGAIAAKGKAPPPSLVELLPDS